MSELEKTNRQEEMTDTLLIHDKQTNKIQAVKGIRKNDRKKETKGELETVEPTKENQNSFLKLNKNEDMLSNFLRNFMSQLNEPTRFNFFKVPIKTAIAIAKKMQRFVDYATLKGEQLIDGLRAIANPNKNQNTMAKQEAQQENNNRYSLEKVDWNSLSNLGWTREEFEKTNLLDSLLRGYKTNDLLPITMKVGGQEISTEAKLYLEPGENGNLEFKMLCKKNNLNLDQKFHGHEFTEDDKTNLLERGNMGRAVNLTTDDKKQVPHIITLDKETKQLVSFPVSKIEIDDVIKGVKLTAEQKSDLKEGKPLYLEGMLSKKDTLFNGEIQFNAFKGHLEFFFDRNNSNKQSNEISNETAVKEIPKKFRRKEFTYDQYNRISKGETVYISDFKDGAGKEYPGYVTLNAKTGDLDFSFKNPNKLKQDAIPAETHKTQTAVNNDGKTNESTKKVREPLESGQTAPRNKKQQNTQKEKSVTTNRRGRKASL